MGRTRLEYLTRLRNSWFDYWSQNIEQARRQHKFVVMGEQYTENEKRELLRVGAKKNKDILIHFLNDILGLTDDNKIKDVSLLIPIQGPVIASQKQSIVDILCVDSTGIKTIIEMQVAKTTGFENAPNIMLLRPIQVKLM